MDLLASGRDADVYRHRDGLVLRRYRDGRSAEVEGALMRELARLGYPVPAVESASGPDLVMEQLEGSTMAAELLNGTLDPREGGRLLAHLHDALHTLPWPGEQPLLHLDLHPLNVIMSGSTAVVIDWANARPGPADLDVAMSALILAQVVISPEIVIDSMPGSASPDDGEAHLVTQLTSLLGSFTSEVSPFSDHLTDAAALRRADPHQSETELAQLADAVDLVHSLI
ncbi:phosphotransferase [Pseudactinotalea sp.]|uniref:phosphotransferase n=1 Tax=Pseudactinotalea sp. TaxID=1926260 RepID=UPI003B3ABFF2